MSISFQHKLKHIRQHHNLTQEEFATLLKISRGHLAKLEAGRVLPTNKLIKSIVAICHIEEKWLLDESEDNLEILQNNDFLTEILIEKYAQLSHDYQVFILEQIEQLIKLQSKVKDSKNL